MKTISDDNRINNYMLLFVVFSDMIYAMMSSLFLLVGLSPICIICCLPRFLLLLQSKVFTGKEVRA